jgi:cytochrome b561
MPSRSIGESDGMAKYSKIAILFHWLIALLIAANILLANLAEDLPRAARAAYMSPHKAIGISILILTVGRILWRLTNRPPALPDKVAGWQAKAGHSVHILFYVLMIAMPLTGWLMIGAKGKAAPVDFFGLFTIDMAVGKNVMLADIGHEGHEILAVPLIILIGLHVLGALKHQFIDKMPFIQRMWP